MTTDVIGHRGARSLYPENTIAGFRAALAGGIRQFEIDIGMTRDGVPVLSHDLCLSPDLARDGSHWIGRTDLPIAGFSLKEVQRFDVGRIRPGSRTARRFPRQAPADGERIPTLDEVLRLHSRAIWTIEIKTDPHQSHLTARPEAIVEAVAAVADAAGAAKRIVVQSFDWRGPRHLRRLRPSLAYAWLSSKRTRTWRGGQAGLPMTVVAEGGGTWSPHHSELTRRLLDRAHDAGLRVVPWTVNAPADIARLGAWGVDGLITDDPFLARAVLNPPPLSPAAPMRTG